MLSCTRVLINTALCAALFCIVPSVESQAAPSAERKIDLTAFGGLTGTYTGLSHGRNLGVTAGIDLNLPRISRTLPLRPAIEVRGTSPFIKGRVDSQKNILAGVRGEFEYGRVHPYVDVLFGRGRIDYFNYLQFSGQTLNGYSTGPVFSPGLGVRLDLGANFFAMAEAQFQRWSTPASLSGHLFSKPLTAGVGYRFTFSHHPSGIR